MVDVSSSTLLSSNSFEVSDESIRHIALDESSRDIGVEETNDRMGDTSNFDLKPSASFDPMDDINRDTAVEITIPIPSVEQLYFGVRELIAGRLHGVVCFADMLHPCAVMLQNRNF